MTEEKFCKFYTEYFGETIDNISQITHHAFTGQELKEFLSASNKELRDEIAGLKFAKKELTIESVDLANELEEEITQLKKDKHEGLALLMDSVDKKTYLELKAKLEDTVKALDYIADSLYVAGLHKTREVAIAALTKINT